ncbi:MAG TPA: hypothetical protein EYM37_07970, partial [Methylophaga aminisulfidivorans]|nr:hypothetical protein [Methylophaga aminisulfidivorans]
LAIRIIFPSVRVIQVSFNLTGLPASLGKQKNEARLRLIFYRKIIVYFSIVANVSAHQSAM